MSADGDKIHFHWWCIYCELEEYCYQI